MKIDNKRSNLEATTEKERLLSELQKAKNLNKKKQIRSKLRALGHFGGLRRAEEKMHNIKIIVEKHPDGYIAYPLGVIKGACVGQGDSYEAALADVKSAIRFHIETFGADAFEKDGLPVLEAFIAEAGIRV
jgi:hypothetical protein